MDIEFNWVRMPRRRENQCFFSLRLLSRYRFFNANQQHYCSQYDDFGNVLGCEEYLTIILIWLKFQKELWNLLSRRPYLWGAFSKPMARYGVLVRQDWLDNLGLEVPKTYDDLKSRSSSPKMIQMAME